VPMAVLAVASLVIGAVLNAHMVAWLAPVVGQPEHYATSMWSLSWVTAAAFVALLLGVGLGVLAYRRGPLAETNLVFKAGEAEFGADAVGDVIVKGGAGLAEATGFVDHYLIDGGARGIMRVVSGFSGLVRGLQSGKVRSYGLIMAIGVLVVLGAVVWVGQVV